METKNYEISLRGKRTVFNGKLKLNLVKNKKVIGEVEKTFDSEMALVLKEPDSSYRLRRIYGNKEYMAMTEIPDELILSPELTSCNGMFNYGRMLKKIDTHLFETSNITNMCAMFMDCQAITELDLRHFDVRKVKTIADMFMYCKNIKTIDITGWDTSECTQFNRAFFGCENLEEIRGILDIRKCGSTFGDMFANCKKLKNVKVIMTDEQKGYFYRHAGITAEQVEIV